MEQTARSALDEVRTAIAGYRASGLGAPVVNSQRALAAAGVDADATVDLPVLPAEHEAALALALREAVTNVVRHADARRTSIRARATVDDVELEVTDDGRGAGGRDGAGLSGMPGTGHGPGRPGRPADGTGRQRQTRHPRPRAVPRTAPTRRCRPP